MTKLAFARGIWSYVSKMDNALRKYSDIRRCQRGPAITAISFIQKVPPGLEPTSTVANGGATRRHGVLTGETKDKKTSRIPSGKVLANGLLLLGGIICLSRGHSSLGAKVAMAYILTRLRKRDSASSGRSGES
uniref:Phosphatidylcholine transfer protein n=1 Tax=Rhizophora mucronata TaxID=61149 RepID=A0A2P2MQY6_RHIMU